MIRKYGTFRKMRMGKPRQMTSLERLRVIAALQPRAKSPPPSGNIWDDDDIWRDKNTWND